MNDELVTNNEIIKNNSLGKKMLITTGILSMIWGLALLSTRITGFTVGSMNQTSTNLAGVALFVFGLVIITIFKNFKKKE